MENETFKISDIKFPEYNHHYENAKKCPKCSSVFISANECESCHFQFGLDILGAPLGEKSFYTMREDYWDSIGFLAKTYPFFEKRVEEQAPFKRAIFHRYEVLLDYFYGPNANKNEKIDNLHFRELKDIVIQLIKYEISEDIIWGPLDQKAFSEEDGKLGLYQQISLSIEEARRDVLANSRPMLLRFFELRIYGTMRLGVLSLFLLSAAITSLLAISVYRYFLIL